MDNSVLFDELFEHPAVDDYLVGLFGNTPEDKTGFVKVLKGHVAEAGKGLGKVVHLKKSSDAVFGGDGDPRNIVETEPRAFKMAHIKVGKVPEPERRSGLLAPLDFNLDYVRVGGYEVLRIKGSDV